MRRWLVRMLVSRGYRALRAGNSAPVVSHFGPDARFRFAGSHSWAIDTTDQHLIESWFERFAALKSQLVVLDVLVSGPPWKMSVCVIFDDSLRDRSGHVVYANHGIQYLRLRWGKIILDEVNLDTQKVADYDALMESATSD
jgi:ketosteroid isomerase-like protein